MSIPSEQHLTAAEYALGLLPPEQAQAFAQQMSQNPALHDAYVYWSERFASLSDEWPDQIPPAHIKAQLLEAIETEEHAPATSIKARSSKPRPLWAMAAAMILVIGLWLVWPNGFEADYQTHLAATDGTLTVDVFVDTDSQQVRVVPLEGAVAEQGDYELWVAVGEGAPISLGVLDITHTATYSMQSDWMRGLSNAHMAISFEPKGGSPTGQPTGPVLAVADTMTL